MSKFNEQMNKSRRGALIGVLLLVFWTVTATAFYKWHEGMTTIDAFYMTVITISTVGYTEAKQLSETGRLFTSFFIVAGIGTSVYTFTRLGQIFFEGEIRELFERRSMKRRLEKLDNHYIICGLGRVGMTVLERFRAQKLQVCIIEHDDTFIDFLEEQHIPYVIGSATQEETLLEAGIDKAKALMAILPSDADNLYLTLAAKDLNKNIEIVARASDSNAHKRLIRGGADHVVSPYNIAGKNMTAALLQPTLTEIIEEVSDPEKDIDMQEFVILQNSILSGKSISECNFRKHANVIIVALKCKSKKLQFNPPSSEILSEGATIVAFGQRAELDKLAEICK